MKARVRNVLWAATLVVGATLFLLPRIMVVVFFVLLLAATLLSIPRVSRRRAPHGHDDHGDPRARFYSNPDVHDPRGGPGWR